MGKVEDQLIERIANRVVDMGLGMISIVFLESLKPLTFLGSSLLVVIKPIVDTFFVVNNYDRFVRLVEDRQNIETLVSRIEHLQNEK